MEVLVPLEEHIPVVIRGEREALILIVVCTRVREILVVGFVLVDIVQVVREIARVVGLRWGTCALERSATTLSEGRNVALD